LRAKKDTSAKTKGNILSVLRTALDDAVEDELLDANPLAGKKMRRKGDTKPRKDEIDPFSAEERAVIVKAAKGQERNFIQFAFWTGLRISELCALDWGDVDWVNKRIFVQRALTQHRKEPETPKTAQPGNAKLSCYRQPWKR
jgi:integrase